MYTEYFGLRALPFEDRADAQFTFFTQEHKDVLATFRLPLVGNAHPTDKPEMRRGRNASLILGETGIGKTQLIRTLSARLSQGDRIVVLTCPASGQRELLREICKGFGLAVTSAIGGQNRRIERLRLHLEHAQLLGHHCVLMIDQAENLSVSNLAQINSLVELHHDGGRLLSVVLVGQPPLRSHLEMPAFARLIDQVSGEYVLHPLNLEQTAAYIRHRLAIVGCHVDDLFDSEAMEWIQSRTGGVPRAINGICRQAMLAACDAGETRITGETLARLEPLRAGMEYSAEWATVGAKGGRLGAPAIPGRKSDLSVRSGSSRAYRLEAGDHTGMRPVPQEDPIDASTPSIDEFDFDPEIGAPSHWCVEGKSAGAAWYDPSVICPDVEPSGLHQPLNPMASLLTRVEHLCRSLSEEGVAAVQAELDARWQALSESIEPTLRLMQSMYEGKTSHTEASTAEVEARVANINQQLALTVSQLEKLEGTCRDRMVAVCQAVVEEQRAAMQRGIHEIIEAARREVKVSCARASDFVSEAEASMGRMRLDVRESMREWERIERDRQGRPTAQPAHEVGDLTDMMSAPQDVLRRLDSHHAAASATLKALAAATIEGRRLLEESNAMDAALRECRNEREKFLTSADREDAGVAASERLGQRAQSGDLKRFGRTAGAEEIDPLAEQTTLADTTAPPSSPRARG